MARARAQAMLQARHYILRHSGSRAADVEAEPGGIVAQRAGGGDPSVESPPPTRRWRAGEFGELVW